MRVVPVKFKTSLGTIERVLAHEVCGGVMVRVVGLSHIDAIQRCLKELNRITFYDATYTTNTP
jgi:hypothetical protein